MATKCLPGESHAWSQTGSRKSGDGKKTITEYRCWKCQATKTEIS